MSTKVTERRPDALLLDGVHIGVDQPEALTQGAELSDYGVGVDAGFGIRLCR